MESIPASHPRRISFDVAAIWALTVSVALSAVAFIPSATIPFIYTKVSILAIGGLIALVLFVLARLTRGNVIVPPVALLGALWLVPGAYLISALFSSAGLRQAVFGTALETDTFGFMLIMAIFATLAAVVFRRTSHYKTFFKVGSVVYAVLLAAQVLFVIASRIVPAKVAATTNLVGSFTDLGMLVGLGITLSLLALRFLTLSNKVRTFFYGAGAVGLLTLALVNSSYIWVLVVLVALGLFIESIMHRRSNTDDFDLDGVDVVTAETGSESTRDTAGTLPAPLAVLVIGLFFLIGGSTIGSALSSSLGANFLDVRPSWQSTFAVGSHTYASSPVFGSGPDTFGVQWLKFRDRTLNDTVFWNVDFSSGIGFIPTSFVTGGIVAALAWLAFIGLFIFIGIRALLFRAPEDVYARYVSIASFVGSLYVLALAVFAVPGPVVLVVGALMMGIFVSSLRYAGTRHEWGVVFSKNPRVGFVIVFGFTLVLLAAIVAAYVVVERYLANVAYAEASQAYAAGNLDEATTDLSRSLLFSKTDSAYQLAAAIGVARMNQIAADTKLSPSDAQTQFQTALSNAVAAALASTQLGPNNYQNWAVLGQVYQTVVPLKIDGAYDNAKAAYQKAIALNPTNPILPYTLAQLDIAAANAPAAEADLTQAITLKNDYTQAIFLLSQLKVQEGKAKEALQAAEAAVYFAPNDPTVLFQVGILRSGTGNPDGAIQALSHAVDINPSYANARFFLAVAYATKAQYAQAIAQLQAVAALSTDNATAVQTYIAQLQAGKNPFPQSQFGALGVTQPPVTQPAATPAGNAVAPAAAK